MALYTRQPFAEIGTSRLQALSSAKNRQNSIVPDCASSLKQTPPVTGKRRASDIFEDDDSENIDPSIFNSPSKKTKTTPSHGYIKPAKFSLMTAPAPAPVKASAPITPSAPVPSVRKALSTPKHKRVGLLSKRRASSSPYRRVDPPTASSHSSPAPFSIDAALKGSIPDYTPKPAVATPKNACTIEESMPNSWFFEIHEDTPEQEAANLMEHSAAVLDISSDDDYATKKKNDELERGKENIPPPDFVLSQAAAQNLQTPTEATETSESPFVSEHTVKLPRLRKIAQDAMDEDRSPLKDLPPADFYAEGLDATSYVTVDAGIERPSSLSKEFDFSVPSPKKEPVEPVESVQLVEPVQPAEPIAPIELAQEQVAC